MLSVCGVTALQPLVNCLFQVLKGLGARLDHVAMLLRLSVSL